MENKPIIIAMNEFKQQIISVINKNKSDIPMSILNLILKDILIQCTELENQQYNIALHKYSDIEVRLNAIEEGQATQNDAIAEMSEVIYSE